MKKSIIAVSLILSLVILVSAQSSKPVQESLEDKKQESPKKCGAVVEGLQFCTTSPVVSVKLGEYIPINVSLQNMTKEAITVPTCGFNHLYNVTVTDSDKNRIFSHEEVVRQRIKDKVVTEGELLKFYPLCHGPLGFEKILAPEEMLRIEYYLNLNYDFKNKGKYNIEISRKITKKDKSSEVEIPLGTMIEIEIK